MPASRQVRLPPSNASAVSATMGVRALPRRASPGADGARCFDAVHAGHVNVGEQKVETTFQHRLDRIMAGRHFRHAMAAAAQQFADQHHVDGIVLGQEDAQALLDLDGARAVAELQERGGDRRRIEIETIVPAVPRPAHRGAIAGA